MPTRKHRRIAVVINLDWTLKHHHEVFGGTQEFARERGWESVLWPYAPEVVDGRGRALYDGIIGRVHPELEERARRAGIPLVNVWVSSPCVDVPAVLPDVSSAGVVATEHLWARGFRRLGYVGFARTRGSRLLQSAIRDSARQKGSRLKSLLVSSSFSDSTRAWSRFQHSLREWVAELERPIGIAAVNDKVARYVINAVLERGFTVPGDVSVIGLENEEVACLNPEPSISSIELGWRAVGFEAGALLEKIMDGASPPEDAVLLPPVSLVPRKSTDSFRVDDDYVAQALKIIAEESHRPIKVRDVVDRIPISGRSLERRFHDCRGVTIAHEIRRFRVERAKRLLAETDMLVKQVAEACGFANTRRLCEVFKRLESVTPEQFREQRARGQ